MWEFFVVVAIVVVVYAVTIEFVVRMIADFLFNTKED